MKKILLTWCECSMLVVTETCCWLQCCQLVTEGFNGKPSYLVTFEFIHQMDFLETSVVFCLF